MTLLIKTSNFFTVLTLFLIFTHSFSLFSQINHIYMNNQSMEYEQIINSYKYLSNNYPKAKLIQYGNTDFGLPLHLFVIDLDEKFSNDTKKIKILINNGIHPGEPCGIDASIKFAENILINKDNIQSKLRNTIICIIPVFNIGGIFNRSSTNRANQNGPEVLGFRGNANNLDLNRDFVKMDSKNTKSFVEIFQHWNPEIFIDTHTSNGADYQYTMTLISTQHNKLNPILGEYLQTKFTPALFSEMETTYPISPYVHSFKKIPENGIKAFLETPRFTSGYTALFNCFGFITETHMFKPFQDRVNSTLKFFEVISTYADKNYNNIKSLVVKANEYDKNSDVFDFQYQLDTNKFDKINFNGYKAQYKTSELTGKERLFYDRNKPFSKTIRNFNYYKSKLSISKPSYYFLSKSEYKTIEYLKMNKVKIQEFTNDTNIIVEVTYINDFNTVKKPYEGHYLHYDINISKDTQNIQIYKGDFLIPMNQSKNRFIINVLEPQAVDSYFAWNFFDNILQQKEWFSSYIFEEKAIEILKNNKGLKTKFNTKKRLDTNFNSNHFQQLYFIYKNSNYYEKSHKRYPIFRSLN